MEVFCKMTYIQRELYSRGLIFKEANIQGDSYQGGLYPRGVISKKGTHKEGYSWGHILKGAMFKEAHVELG